MNITLLSVNARSACFELAGSPGVYCAPAPYSVYLNGRLHTTGDTNVFSLFGLAPAMSYNLRVELEDGGSLSCEFVTPGETMLLDAARFGCVPGGAADCTGALQAAIDACRPGGTVYLGPGVYHSYPLFLKSGILLYLDEGAVLLGGTDRARYPVLPGMVVNEAAHTEQTFASWEGNPLDSYASLITVVDAENVTVAGPGTIDGNAQNAGWWQNPKQKAGAWRPRTVFAVRAQNLTLLGVTIQNSPAWTIHPYRSTGVDVLGVRVQNPPDSPNTDGCNPESCTDVRVMGADISVGDDCISVKSGKYYMAVHHPAPARNILVRNCLLRRGHGAVVVGSEISAGVDGLRVERCLMRDTDRGLRIKTRRGRGSASVVDNVALSDIVMERVLAPFVVNMYYSCDPDGHTSSVRDKAPRPVDDLTPAVRSISCRHIRCTGAQQAGVFLYGLPESPIGSVAMEDVTIEFAPGAKAGMPAMMDDLAPMKQQALFAANVRRLELRGVTFTGYAGQRLALQQVEELAETNTANCGEEVPHGKDANHADAAAVCG